MLSKKILIVGPKFYDYNQSIEKAFVKLGHSTKVISFLDKDVEGLQEKIVYHLSKDKKAFFDKKRIKFGETFKAIYDEYKPDILFIIKGSIFLPQTLAYAKNSINVLWMMDGLYQNPYCYNLRKQVHHLFLFEQADIDRLKKEENINAYLLPLGLDESVYYPIENKKDIDILFVGVLYPNRITLLKKLIANFPDKKIKIYGHYFPSLRQPFRYLFRKDKKTFVNKKITREQANELYSRAKLCLNIHHQQSVKSVNLRFFEITGAKALQVVDYKPYIENNFTKNEVICFKNEGELFSKIKLALSNYENHKPALQTAYNKIIARHTFTARMQEVLSIL